MSVMTRVCGLLAVLAVCGCSTTPVARYTCGAAAVTAAFHGQDRAGITVGGATHDVARAMAASGARYEGGMGDDYVEFWEHQGTARLTVGRTVYPECRPVN